MALSRHLCRCWDFLGSRFESYICNYDHWIAFILLALIGINMIRESLTKGDECDVNSGSLKFSDMFPMAVATSIDALAVGITFAVLRVNILPAVGFIGIITFSLSVIGVKAGCIFGTKYKSKAELAGGIILVLIGLKSFWSIWDYWDKRYSCIRFLQTTL